MEPGGRAVAANRVGQARARVVERADLVVVPVALELHRREVGARAHFVLEVATSPASATPATNRFGSESRVDERPIGG